MNVINAAIQIAQDSKLDDGEMTVFEKFTDFNEYLFWTGQHKPYQKLISSLD